MIDIKKIDVGLDSVDYIYHVSDIHIRNFKRHEEYARVFKSLKSSIADDNKPNSLVIITGDIVHSKTDVTPELVQEVQSFLKLLSERNHVVVTAGNHDTNLNNNDRLDALTPIINAINSDRIHYLKDGGVYKLGNLHLTVWSVFDNPNTYIKANEFEAETKIATFHGAVYDATTESGFKLSHETIKASNFDGYDMVLLGDIHKFQYLNENKTIAYPGSLIQQNHAESLDHGILVWNIKDKTNRFVKVHNNTFFYTIYVDNGFHDEISLDPAIYKRMYLRIRHKNTSQRDLKNIVTKLISSYEVVEISYQKIQDLENHYEIDNHNNSIHTRQIEYQNKVIIDYLIRKDKLVESDIAEIIEINKATNNKITKPELSRNSTWIPKRFEFDDMFSYGKNNYVDFTNMIGTYGLFAPNTSGKSTLLDAISYCLFDKCSKTNKGWQVMNNNSNTFSCSFIFEMNGVEYGINRSATRQKGGNVRVEVEFWCIDENGEKKSLNGKERNDTNNNIRKIVGSYEDFELTALSTQNASAGFVDMNQKDRKDLLSQFLDINVFEELYVAANNELRDTIAVLKSYENKNYRESLIKSESDIDSITIEIEKINSLKNEIDTQISCENDEVILLSSKISALSIGDIDIKDIVEKKQKVYDNIIALRSKCESLEKHINTLREEESSIHITQDGDLSESDLEIELQKLKDVLEARYELNIDIRQNETELNAKKEKLDKLKDLTYDTNCSYCMDNIFVKDAIATSSSFCESQRVLKEKQDQLSVINSQLSGSLRYERIKKERIDIKNRAIELHNKISETTIELTKVQSKIKENSVYLAGINEKINLYEIQKFAAESNSKIKIKIQELNDKIFTLRQSSKEINEKLTDLLSDKKLAEAEKLKCQSYIEEIQLLEKKRTNFQLYLSAVHRDGVPHAIISNIIPKIEEEINSILNQLVDFNIVLQTDDKNINVYIAYDDDRFWPIELTSGMEKFISSLAIRTAMINVSTLPRPNFIAIDEGFGSLDKKNLSSMSSFFEYLKTQFKFIMIISHIESMIDIVDHHIEIHKVKGRSKVQQNP